MNYLSKIFAVLIITNLTLLPAVALELDLSVDEEIRKNYNPSKLELESLPPLPNVKPTTSKPPLEPVEVPKPVNNLPELLPADQKPVISKIDKSSAIRIKKGTKFKVKSNQALSDSMRKGTRISFRSLQPVTQTYVTIPAGTVFKGEIENTHLPQYTGNGGLIVLSIDSMVLRGSTTKIEAKIIRANQKKILLNNIKGNREYFKGVKNSLKPGTKFYKKSMRTTSKLANGTITVLLTPFTVAAGVIVYAVNFAGAPFFGLFSKGGRIIITAGAEFEIKLLDDVYLY